MSTATRITEHNRWLTTTSAMWLFAEDIEGRVSRNLLVNEEHPDAWVLITGPWAGLSYTAGPSLGDPTTGLPAAKPWTPGGQR